jgi:hypothetical protein
MQQITIDQKTVQEKADADRTKDREQMLAAIHSVQSKIRETIGQRMENVMTEINQKTEGLCTELYETQKDLQVTKTSLNTQRNDLMETIRDTKEYLQLKLTSFKDNTQNLINSKQDTMEAKIESTRLEFQSQLEEVMARAELGRRQGVCTSTAQPPTFDGTTFWAVFRRQFETVAEHNCWTRLEKPMYLITSLQGRATDVLHGIPKSATYEETLLAVEDRLGDHHFTAACRSQLKTRTQRTGESLQESATAIEQLTHRAYPTLPEKHIRREAGKAFADGVEDQAIKIQLLLGGGKR